MTVIALLTKEPKTYDSRALLRAIEAVGYEALVLDYTDPEALFRIGDRKITAVIPRHTPQYASRVAEIVEALESKDVYSVAGAHAIRSANNKYATYICLSGKQIATPNTILLGESSAPGLAELQEVFGNQCVVKPVSGSKGHGVELVRLDSTVDLDRYIDSGDKYIAQEYIEEAAGEDIRAFVVGGQVVAAMKRTSQGSDFRSNLHLGGTASAVALGEEERKLAVSAASAVGLHVAGIDIIRSERGPMVIEVNSSPGLMGIEKATGIHIAVSILDHIKHATS